MDRIPVISRKPIVDRHPINSNTIEYYGCTISDNRSCNGTVFCNARDSLEEYDRSIFRLIRVLDSDTNWDELMDDIRFLKDQCCSIRLITDVPIPKEVLFEMAYNPYNVVQFNIDLLDTTNKTLQMKSNVFVADNCGLYTSILAYPVIPDVTKTWDVLEFLNSLRCACNTLCFRFIELPEDTPKDEGCFIVKGYLLPEKYMELKDGKYICKSSFKESFSSIIMAYTSPRKINCSLCNDCICY